MSVAHFLAVNGILLAGTNLLVMRRYVRFNKTIKLALAGAFYCLNEGVIVGSTMLPVIMAELSE